MKKQILRGLALAVLAAALGAMMAGCDGGSSSGGGYYDPYARAWYDVYGDYCYTGRPAPGCNFYADGTKIYDYEDPYYSTHYNLKYGTWYYVDSYGYDRTFHGWAWESPDGVLYDEWGYALNEAGQDESRDLLTDVAGMESKAAQEAGKAFAAKYALAEEQGMKIAKTLMDWAKLGKARSRTQEDIADFSKNLFGVSLDKAEEAVNLAKKGDASGIESLNGDVASHWGTSPETSKEILKGWYADQVGGIR